MCWPFLECFTTVCRQSTWYLLLGYLKQARLKWLSCAMLVRELGRIGMIYIILAKEIFSLTAAISLLSQYRSCQPFGYGQ